MRLTLRTLLAYLDRNHLAKMLSAEEAQALDDLGEKIAANEFASSLVERIHSSTTRPRLGAPKLDGRGIGLDPNTVSEFLDNSLAQERMQEFEKVCLESDVHLSEVASCHHILSLVLAERAEVTPELREKIHQLPQEMLERKEQSQETPLATTSITTSDVGSGEKSPSRREMDASRGPPPKRLRRKRKSPESVGSSSRESTTRPTIERKPQIPDYLRDARRNSWKPWLVSAALVLLLVTIGMLAMGNLDDTHPVLGPLLASRDAGGAPLSPSEADIADASQDPASRPPASADSAVESPQRGTNGEPSGRAPMASDADRAADRVADREATAVEPGPGEVPLSDEELAARDDMSDIPPDITAVQPRTEAARPDRDTGDARNDLVDDEFADIPPDPRPEASRVAEPAGEVPDRGRPTAGRDGTDPFADLARALSGESDPDAPPSDPAPPADDELDSDEEEAAPARDAREVGRLVTAERDHVMAHWSSDRMGWYRLAPRTVLNSAERLLVFPTYRPQIALSSGIHMMLIGPAESELALTDRSGDTELTLHEGRVLLDTSGIAGSQLIVTFVGGSGVLTFESSDSAAALEVRPMAAPGRDPGADAPPVNLEVFATTGNLSWRDGDGNTIPLKSGQVLMLSSDNPAVVHDAGSPPSWITPREQRAIELRASRDLAQLVDTDRPISLSLFEQVGHRQIEVSALAIESLTMLHEFDPLVQALGSERHQSYWRSYVAALERSIHRGPEVADRVKSALERQSPDDFEVLYRLLYGFSEQQLSAGAARDLVTWLRSSLMEVRILAFENLRRITGRNYLYRPERDPNQQRKPLQDWENALNRGEITYRSSSN
jgi:hypothetical protein